MLSREKKKYITETKVNNNGWTTMLYNNTRGKIRKQTKSETKGHKSAKNMHLTNFLTDFIQYIEALMKK